MFLQPAEPVVEPLMLRDHRPNLGEHIPHLLGHALQRVFVPQCNRGQHANIIAHCGLVREHALHLSAEKL
jgi:hypothetical protein